MHQSIAQAVRDHGVDTMFGLVGDANLFAHWQPTYSGTDAPGWGEGWQHHIGTGMSFTF